MAPYVITISRQFASLGRSIAQVTAETLGIEFYDRDIVEAAAKRMGYPVSLISDKEEKSPSKFFKRMYPLGMEVANIQDEIFNIQSNIIQDKAKEKSCIIVGRCGNYVLKDAPKALHVYIYAPYEERLKNCIEVLNMSPQKAPNTLKKVDAAREDYRKKYSKTLPSIYDGYNLMIDSSKFGVDGSAALIVDALNKTLKESEK